MGKKFLKMIHLKTYKLFENQYINESDGEDYYNGITKEFIKDMFIDINDMGFNVSVYFNKRAVVKKTKPENRTEITPFNLKMNIGIIPYIYVNIKYDTYNKSDRLSKLYNLINSDDLKEIIDVCNDRLDEFGWFVSYDKILVDNPPILKIFIYRKIDKKYIK